MLWVYGHHKYFISHNARIYFGRDVFRRQILTYKEDPRAERVKCRDMFVYSAGSTRRGIRVYPSLRRGIMV